MIRCRWFGHRWSEAHSYTVGWQRKEFGRVVTIPIVLWRVCSRCGHEEATGSKHTDLRAVIERGVYEAAWSQPELD